jgi:hypothetical protein
LTEEEAKTKWCPAARHSCDESTGPGWNTGNSPLCQGSMCMAWRWDGTEITEESPMSKKDKHGDFENAERPEGGGWLPEYVETWSDRKGGTRSHIMRWTRKFKSGYCGLAGKP